MNTLNCESQTLLELWLAHLRERNRSARTLQAYGYTLHAAFCFWRSSCSLRDLREVTLLDVEKWAEALRARGTAPITREYYLLPLKGFFSWAEANGHLFENPARSFVLPKTPRRLNGVPSEQDVRRLLEQFRCTSPDELRDRAILEVLYGAGLRLGEVASLDLQSIDFGNGAVRVFGKGAKERVTPMPRLAISAVKSYLERGRPRFVDPNASAPEALWLSSSGKKLSPASVRKITTKRAQTAGLLLTPHALRRAFATHMLRRGASPIDLQRLLGHESFRQMRHYLRYAILDLKRAHARSRVSR
jgi:site-specific recombinase XerD